MTVSTQLLYGMPLEAAAFDEYFAAHHHDLLLRIPNVQQVVVHRVAGAALGDSPFHMMVELQFDSEEAMQEGLNSETGQSMASDFGNFTSGGVTVLFCEATIETPTA